MGWVVPKEIHYKFLAEHSAAPEARLSVSMCVREGGREGELPRMAGWLVRW